MGTSSTAINAIVDALKSDLETATTLGLGASPTVYERDEEPAQIERENLPCAFMVPIVEEGCTVDMNMPWFPADFDFGITVMAFYKGNGDTPTDLQTDLRSIRDYSFNFVDYYRTKTGGAILNRGSIRNIRLDQGYWISGGGNIFHFWTAKLDITMKI
ncbi:MAG: hypothetical protein WC489_06780 [Patescibacteria group bacterium]|jgi:hypothetical protein